jgi:hypothetical protein
LKEILENSQLLKEVAARSYRNPNGFHRLGLFKTKTGAEIRFHVWEDSVSATIENIHQHNWDMVSTMLVGSFENHTYKFNEQISDSDKKTIQSYEAKLNQMSASRTEIVQAMEWLELQKFGTDAELDQARMQRARPEEIDASLGMLAERLDINRDGITRLLNLRIGYRLPPRNAEGDYLPQDPRYTGIERNGVKTISAGESYFHDQKAPHKIVADPRHAGTIATALFTSPPYTKDTFFTERIGVPPRPTRMAKPYTPEQVREVIVHYLKAMGEPVPSGKPNLVASLLAARLG